MRTWVTQSVKESPLFVIIPLSLFLNGFWFWWGLPNGVHTWATDGIAPLEPLVAAKRMFVDDWWNSGYYNKFPMGHFFVLMAAYAPYIVYLVVMGGLKNPTNDYPYGLSDPETALTVLSLIAHGVSVLMGVGIVVLTFLTARTLFGQRGAIFAALIVAFSPVFIFYAHTSNVDTPHLFWCALGLFGFARLVKGQMEMQNYALLGFAAGMAIGTKEQAYGLFILLPFLVLALHVRHHLNGDFRPGQFIRALSHSKIVCGLGISVLTFVLVTHLIFNWDGNVQRLLYRTAGIHPDEQRVIAQAGGIMGTSLFLERWQETISLLVGSMNPLLFLASLLGLVYFPYKERWAAFFAVPVFSYLFFVVMIIAVQARFVMELVLVLALFGGRFFAGAWSWGMERGRTVLMLLGAVWIYSLVYGFNVDYLMMNDARYKAEAWIQTTLRPGASVETYSKPTYLPRLPKNLTVHQASFDEESLSRLQERSPDYIILSSAAYSQFKKASPEEKLLTRLLRGEFGYRPIQAFKTESLLGPILIPGLSPQIVILGKQS
jgi:Dolichyl-phosphate-mannose-protein mannosyltransferase